MRSLAETIEDHAMDALEATNGNKSAAARLIAVHRSRIRRIIARALKRGKNRNREKDSAIDGALDDLVRRVGWAIAGMR